ncbi:MAG: hypothetical protein WD232_08445 [Acidimicrobiales bacterium]
MREPLVSGATGEPLRGEPDAVAAVLEQLATGITVDPDALRYGRIRPDEVAAFRRGDLVTGE